MNLHIGRFSLAIGHNPEHHTFVHSTPSFYLADHSK